MNNQRRKDIQALAEKLDALENLKTEIKEAIEELRDEEQEYYDNMPDSFRDGDKGYAAEAAIDNLEEALSPLDDLSVEDIKSSLESATE